MGYKTPCDTEWSSVHPQLIRLMCSVYPSFFSCVPLTCSLSRPVFLLLCGCPLRHVVTVQVLMASQLLDACKNKAESVEHLAQPQDFTSECGQFSLGSPRNLSLPLTKSPSLTSMPLPRSPSLKSARSPSSYFQLCY